MARREWSGVAPRTQLSGSMTNSATSFTVDNGTGYPTGASFPFVVCIDKGQSTEEKILCESRSSNDFTVATDGRGYDGTTAQAHADDAYVEHVVSSVEIEDFTDHIYDTTRDDHTQYLKVADNLSDLASAPTARTNLGLAIGTDVLAVPGAATTSWSPTLYQNNSSVATSTNSGWYFKLGRLVVAWFRLVANANGSAGSDIQVDLPVSAANGQVTAILVFGAGHFTDASGPTNYPVYYRVAAAQRITAYRQDSTSTGGLGTDPSVALAANDVLTGFVVYEAAS